MNETTPPRRIRLTAKGFAVAQLIDEARGETLDLDAAEALYEAGKRPTENEGA